MCGTDENPSQGPKAETTAAAAAGAPTLTLSQLQTVCDPARMPGFYGRMRDSLVIAATATMMMENLPWKI